MTNSLYKDIQRDKRIPITVALCSSTFLYNRIALFNWDMLFFVLFPSALTTVFQAQIFAALPPNTRQQESQGKCVYEGLAGEVLDLTFVFGDFSQDIWFVFRCFQ